MNDPHLKRLVTALDTTVEWAASQKSPVIHADIELARLRLQCLSRRLGSAVSASPYLTFIERLCATASVPGQQAVATGA